MGCSYTRIPQLSCLPREFIPPTPSLKKAEFRLVPVLSNSLPLLSFCLSPSKHWLPWWWDAHTSSPGFSKETPALSGKTDVYNNVIKGVAFSTLYLIVQKRVTNTWSCGIHVHVSEGRDMRRGKPLWAWSKEEPPVTRSWWDLFQTTTHGAREFSWGLSPYYLHQREHFPKTHSFLTCRHKPIFMKGMFHGRLYKGHDLIEDHHELVW